jgi:hypothetical protein
VGSERVSIKKEGGTSEVKIKKEEGGSGTAAVDS